jgi:hypothetical protein
LTISAFLLRQHELGLYAWKQREYSSSLRHLLSDGLGW